MGFQGTTARGGRLEGGRTGAVMAPTRTARRSRCRNHRGDACATERLQERQPTNPRVSLIVRAGLLGFSLMTSQ